eukprot:14755771-Alexandrium_andersonii.AAC.1
MFTATIAGMPTWSLGDIGLIPGAAPSAAYNFVCDPKFELAIDPIASPVSDLIFDMSCGPTYKEVGRVAPVR